MTRSTVRNFVIAGLCLLVPLVWQVVANINKPTADNCLKSNPASLIFVLDQTGQLSQLTQSHIEAVIERKLLNAQAHTRVSIYNISSDGTNFKPVLEACIPKQRTWSTRITEREKDVLKKWENFKSRIKANVRFDSAESESSPIYRTLTNIVRDGKTVIDPSQTDLVIFSDFIEYSEDGDLFSSCDATSTPQIADSIRRRVTNDETERPFSGISVERHIIPRDGGKSREYRTCVKQVSDMVFNGLGMGSMGASHSVHWAPGSSQD